MPKKKYYKDKANKESTSVKFPLWMPKYLKEKLEQQAEAEGCSQAWITCRALMKELNIGYEELKANAGERPPKTFEERRENKLKGEIFGENKSTKEKT